VRIRALFDDGAMISAMCTSIFKKIKHQLHNWSESDRHLRMANGSIVKAVAKWMGMVRIKGIKTQSTFKVFNSGGSWGFLLGNQHSKHLQQFHEYETDIITITDESRAITLEN
ncbi:hypothetical protein BDR04DRAFT_944488, partial [Suillus decipiens]